MEKNQKLARSVMALRSLAGAGMGSLIATLPCLQVMPQTAPANAAGCPPPVLASLRLPDGADDSGGIPDNLTVGFGLLQLLNHLFLQGVNRFKYQGGWETTIAV